MKKVLAIMLIIATCCTCAFAFAACDTKTDKNAETVYDGKLVVATNAAFPPFEMVDDNGNYIGVDMELAYAIGKVLNYEVEIKDMEFDSIISAIESGQATIGMAGMSVSAARLEHVDFCDEYFDAGQVVIAKSGSAIANATTVEGLEAAIVGKKIGFQNGTVGEYYVKGDSDWGFDGVKDATAIGYTNGAAAVLALNNGQIDCIVIDVEPAKEFVKANTGLVAMTSIPVYTDKYAFAVKKGDTKTQQMVNAALVILKQKGTFAEIVNKYFGD